MAEWQGVISATAPKFLKGAADQTIRQRLILALLKRYGRIKYNENGATCTWAVQNNEQQVEAYGDGGQLSFERHNLVTQLTIDWRGYVTTDSMTKKERLMNDGDVAIFKRYDRILPTLMQAMTNKFSAELFIDGNAAGNQNRLHGLESFFGAGTCATADRVAAPNDNYGGRSTVVGNDGGTWTTTNGLTSPNSSIGTDWPDGSGDVLYDYISPKLINASSSGWIGAGNVGWEDTCLRALRQSVIWTTRLGGKDGMPTVHLMSSDMYYPFLNKAQGMLRALVPYKEAEDLGFNGAVQFEGVGLQHDFDVPSRTVYSMNVNQMELSSLNSVLFGSEGPEWDMKMQAFLFAIGFFGNLRYNPKFFAKIYPYA